MATFIPSPVTKRRRRAALHATLYTSREHRVHRSLPLGPPPAGKAYLRGADGLFLLGADGQYLLGAS